MTKPTVQLFAQVKQRGRWRTVECLETDQEFLARAWFNDLLNKYRPTKPKMRLVAAYAKLDP